MTYPGALWQKSIPEIKSIASFRSLMKLPHRRTLLIAAAIAFIAACVGVYGYGMWRARIEDELSWRSIRTLEETPEWVNRTDKFIKHQLREKPRVRRWCVRAIEPILAAAGSLPNQIYIEYPADNVEGYELLGSGLFRKVEEVNVLCDYKASDVLTQLPEFSSCRVLDVRQAARIEAGDLAAIYHNFPALEELYLSGVFISWEGTSIFQDREITTLSVDMHTVVNTPEVNEIRSDLSRPTSEEMEQIVANFPHVQRLYLHVGAPETIQLAEKLPHLELLYLGSHPPVPELDLQRFPSLTELEVSVPYRSPAYLFDGPRAPNIRRFRIAGSSDFQIPVEALRTKFPSLERLALYYGYVSEKAIRGLFEEKSFSVLSLKKIRLSSHADPENLSRSTEVVIYRSQSDLQELSEEYPTARLLPVDRLDDLFGR